MERVLIIGNGFDLAHGLPTRYNDFLFFCCQRMKKKFIYTPKDLDLANEVNHIFEQTFRNEYDHIIEKNSWINYFIRIYDESKKNWIDFETEIKKVCIEVSEYEKSEGVNQFTIKDEYPEFVDYEFLCFKKDMMKEDLDDLINILDLYLKSVNLLSNCTYSKDIINFYPTKVISFNYTDTYRKIYDRRANVEYIHGKLSDNKHLNSIVLGFNSLEDNELDIEFSEYIKYFQMVNKDVTTDLFNEIEKISSDVRVETMIFGHSLDITDQNIIKGIIEKSKIVYVMYKDEKHKSELIKKIIVLYGENTFMDLCLREKKKIRFMKQKNVDESLDFDRDSILEMNRIIHNNVNNDEIKNLVFNNQFDVFGAYGCITLISKIISVNKSSKFEPKILKLMFDSIMEHIRNVCSYEDNYLISYKKVCDIVKGILAKNKLEHLFE